MATGAPAMGEVKAGMTRHYRCYFLGSDGKFKDFVDIICADDSAAVAKAQQCFAAYPECAAFEIWEAARKVYLGRRVVPPARIQPS
jgi:hypothetical protein